MVRIALHDNAISELGTSVAVYDYAYFLKRMGHTVFVCGSRNHPATNKRSIEFLKKEFSEYLCVYNTLDQLWECLRLNNVEYFYCIKCGNLDGVIAPHPIKTLVHCTGLLVEPHGDVYATVSRWMSEYRSTRGKGPREPFVDHMIHLPDTPENFRVELGIPVDAVVFGRYGGKGTFDIDFVYEVIHNIVNERSDVYFLLANTNQFLNHPRVIYFDAIIDRLDKVRFINSCDAMIHARIQGESFGLACGEFSSKNKPVITWTGSVARTHIEILGKNGQGLFYSDSSELYEILRNFKPEPEKDWNAYRDFVPSKVMSQFVEVFLNQKCEPVTLR